MSYTLAYVFVIALAIVGYQIGRGLRRMIERYELMKMQRELRR